MEIGVPKEIKDREGRVAVTPDGVAALIADGHRVYVEAGAGLGAGFSDEAYQQAGAQMVTAAQAWGQPLVVKVKEPLASEYTYLQGQCVFTFFHLAGVPFELTEALLKSKTTAIAYETLEDAAGRLPLLAPMSAIAGNMASLMGAYYLGRTQGGLGVQLGRVLGVRHGRVLVIGDGVVGYHAAQTAYGLGAEVRVAGMDAVKGQRIRDEISPEIAFFTADDQRMAEETAAADLVVGGVLRHGAKADYVVTERMVAAMQPGSVIVDVSIDQGGCVETSRPTSHSDPVFSVHDVIHYCVTNMPGAYPRTATLALTDATLPYLRKIAAGGLAAVQADPGMARAVNTHAGYLTCLAAAEGLGLLQSYRALESFQA